MSEAGQDPVAVVFRTWSRREGGGVIALFPGLPRDRAGALVTSYEHTGQHGGADYDGVMRRTRPATGEEYAALKRELEARPFSYRLKVVRRRPR